MGKRHKITLGMARDQGDFMLLLHCGNLGANCWHSGEMRLDTAIARWGEALRLDQIPARCSRCGAREFVDVRARPPKRVGASGPIIET